MSVERYSPFTKFLHWLIAFAVIGMLAFGFFLDDVPENLQGLAYMLHKSTGITILFLVILRIIWIHKSKKPPLPATVALWQKVIARSVQYLLYVFLLLMPLSGWIMSVAADKIPSWYGLFQLPLPMISPDKPLAKLMNQSHKIMALVLIGLITLHILGALKHHFIDKDNVLKRMLPGA